LFSPRHDADDCHYHAATPPLLTPLLYVFARFYAIDVSSLFDFRRYAAFDCRRYAIIISPLSIFDISILSLRHFAILLPLMLPLFSLIFSLRAIAIFHAATIFATTLLPLFPPLLPPLRHAAYFMLSLLISFRHSIPFSFHAAIALPTPPPFFFRLIRFHYASAAPHWRHARLASLFISAIKRDKALEMARVADARAQHAARGGDDAFMLPARDARGVLSDAKRFAAG
jgi:hypothetical protein